MTDMLTVREVADQLHTSPDKVYRLCKQKKLRHYALFGSIRIKQVDVDAMLASVVQEAS